MEQAVLNRRCSVPGHKNAIAVIALKHTAANHWVCRLHPNARAARVAIGDGDATQHGVALHPHRRVLASKTGANEATAPLNDRVFALGGFITSQSHPFRNHQRKRFTRGGAIGSRGQLHHITRLSLAEGVGDGAEGGPLATAGGRVRAHGRVHMQDAGIAGQGAGDRLGAGGSHRFSGHQRSCNTLHHRQSQQQSQNGLSRTGLVDTLGAQHSHRSSLMGCERSDWI